jgi:hypothetical protein
MHYRDALLLESNRARPGRILTDMIEADRIVNMYPLMPSEVVFSSVK